MRGGLYLGSPQNDLPLIGAPACRFGRLTRNVQSAEIHYKISLYVAGDAFADLSVVVVVP